MLRDIKTGWKIPISYNFCKSTTKTTQLIRCIKETVKEVTKAGCIIVAILCDQGSSNVAALKQMLNDTRSDCLRTGKEFDKTITLHGQKIIVLFDPPHLLKGIRNNFLTKDIEIMYKDNSNKKGIALWSVIESAYQLDIHATTLNRQLKKLTDQHIKKDKINKIR